MKEKLQRQKNLCITPSDFFPEHGEFKMQEGCCFPQETIEGLAGLCEILKEIRQRLIAEGYVIIEGRFYSPQGELVYERKYPV